jgi:hypothetical protein
MEIVQFCGSAFWNIPDATKRSIGVVVEPSLCVARSIGTELGVGRTELLAKDGSGCRIQAEADDVQKIRAFLRCAAVHDRL